MVNIERDPDGIFAGIWLGWYSCVLYALARPDVPALGLVVLLAFLPVEVIAMMRTNGPRDTLSEIVTWCVRQVSKHDRPLKGWNALLLAVVLSIAWLLGRTVEHYAGSPLLAWPMAGLVAVWLDGHWRAPHRHG